MRKDYFKIEIWTLWNATNEFKLLDINIELIPMIYRSLTDEMRTLQSKKLENSIVLLLYIVL